MTAKETLELVKETKGLAFVYADDYEWLFLDGKLIAEGHSISAQLALTAIKRPYGIVGRTLEGEEGETFQYLAEATNPHGYVTN